MNGRAIELRDTEIAIGAGWQRQAAYVISSGEVGDGYSARRHRMPYFCEKQYSNILMLGLSEKSQSTEVISN